MNTLDRLSDPQFDIPWTKGEGDDWMVQSGYEEIYNGEGRSAGELRFYKGNPGRFYQTYGNGGGPGGWGGYWKRRDHVNKEITVWKVEGEVFTLLPGKTFHLVGVPYYPVSIHWWCKVD